MGRAGEGSSLIVVLLDVVGVIVLLARRSIDFHWVSEF